MIWPVEPLMVTTSPLPKVSPPALNVDLHRGRADDARPPHATRHHRRVARHAAARGDDAGGGVHALHVLWRSLDPGEDEGVALRLEMHRLVGIEHELAGGGTGGSWEALTDDELRRVRIKRRV